MAVRLLRFTCRLDVDPKGLEGEGGKVKGERGKLGLIHGAVLRRRRENFKREQRKNPWKNPSAFSKIHSKISLSPFPLSLFPL
jgi:hypothetical protein